LNKSKTYYEITYSDHYIFTIDDLNEIVRRFNNIKTPNKIILTTEKDAVRLTKFQQELAGLPFYVIPIELRFLFDEEKTFMGLITAFISNFLKNKHKD
jgi:tetraacyldisaccharide 4'-kinase